MDPIRTAVKISLVPLRTIVQLGESFVGEEQEPQPQREQPKPRAARKQQSRRAATQGRARKADPQATQRPKDLDDVGLARKVESIIFREDTVPKGKIDVNAADGVVWLRGEARTPEMIKDLARQTEAIPEVKRVENLLHLPKTPAPTRADTPPSQRKTQRTPREPAERKVETAVTGQTNGGGS
jgi:hypothetical protein